MFQEDGKKVIVLFANLRTLTNPLPRGEGEKRYKPVTSFTE
jgi:hypothetical protein